MALNRCIEKSSTILSGIGLSAVEVSLYFNKLDRGKLRRWAGDGVSWVYLTTPFKYISFLSKPCIVSFCARLRALI